MIHIRKHPVFERHGNDILNIIALSFPLACLGGEIEVPTIMGKKAKMKIPPGTENGHIFRMKGNGIPYLGSYGRGDQLVKVNIYVPKKLTPRQKELLAEFAKLDFSHLRITVGNDEQCQALLDALTQILA